MEAFYYTIIRWLFLCPASKSIYIYKRHTITHHDFVCANNFFRMVAVKWMDKDIRHNMRRGLTWEKSKVKMKVSHKTNNIDTDSVFFFYSFIIPSAPHVSQPHSHFLSFCLSCSCFSLSIARNFSFFLYLLSPLSEKFKQFYVSKSWACQTTGVSIGLFASSADECVWIIHVVIL